MMIISYTCTYIPPISRAMDFNVAMVIGIKIIGVYKLRQQMCSYWRGTLL